MSRRFVAFFVLALIGAAFARPESALAGGLRAGGGGFRAPMMMRHSPRMLLRPRQAYASQPIRPFQPVTAAGTIQPSPHGFGTTSVLQPFAHLARRNHRIYHAGWVFPATFGGDYVAGYIGSPYDPAEAIPVYGPPPASGLEMAGPALPLRAPAGVSRSANEAEDPNNACRAEKVIVPARDGQREITVVRC